MEGAREEQGIKGTGMVPSTLPSVEVDHNISHPYWVHFDSNSWLEVGWVYGEDQTACPTQAETAPKYYWFINDDGTETHACSTTTASGNPTFEISDSNRDGTWDIKINGVVQTSKSMPTKGELKVGGESIHGDNGMDSKASSLKYYPVDSGSWTNWTHSLNHQNSPYSTDWCTQYTSFEFGVSPSC